MKNLELIIALLFLTLLTSYPTLAQGAPPATPIDGGLSLLLVAGGIYAVKRLKDGK